MRTAKPVLVALRTLRNEADAVLSARPKGKNSFFILMKTKETYESKEFL
jgi:hypothetical protein